jgi:hypothetical protein
MRLWQENECDMPVVQCEGAVLTYGSCKLEAADAEADMDLICVAPGVGAL